jgi:hypothetical protein
MTVSQRFHMLFVLCVGASFGAAVYAFMSAKAPRVMAQAALSESEFDRLAGEIETIKSKLPDQAHAMQDVGYHFSNLWFAAQREHWELANFYWLETRSHLRWAARIIPMRKDNAGGDVDVQTILEAFENGPLTQLEKAIAARDLAAFESTYRVTIEGCYACHKAADKPFIRPQVPTQPETPIINFDPHAVWPR